VLFVLERELQRIDPGTKGVMVGFGPGLALGSVSARRPRAARRYDMTTTASDEAPERLWTALVVDDAREARRVIVQKLRHLPLRVFQATDAFDALLRFGEVQPHIVLTDLFMPGEDGIELLRRIREFSEVPVVILTTLPSVAACERAMLGGAQRFLSWSDGIDILPEVVLELVEGKRSERGAGEVDLAIARERKEQDLRTQLERLLRECNGNIAMIAERLQKDRATVTYHLKRLGLFRPSGRARLADAEIHAASEVSD
jgi:DNA-binding NtrC family response regulator